MLTDSFYSKFNFSYFETMFIGALRLLDKGARQTKIIIFL